MMTTFGHVFHDFAGSAIVHSVGGVLALIGAIALGPRRGKYDANGKSRAIPGHSLIMAALGVFILCQHNLSCFLISTAKLRKNEHTNCKKCHFYFVLSVICRIFAPK